MYRKRQLRRCEICGKDFWFRNCHAKRPGRPGRFCSNACRAKGQYGHGNPNITELGIKYGPVAAKLYGAKLRYGMFRRMALEKLSGKPPVCARCGCDDYRILEVNHRNGVSRERRHRENGVILWRMVLKTENSEKYFNVLCKVCNQADYVERAFGIEQKHQIRWVE